MPKRMPVGTGSKVEIRPGYWQLFVSTGVDPVTGKRRRETKGFAGNATDAQRELNKLLARAQTGRTTPSQVTLEQLLERHLADLEAKHIAPGTLRGYRLSAKNHIVPAIGAVQLNELSIEEHLDPFVNRLASWAEPTTLRKIVAPLKGALTSAVRWGWTDYNIARDLKLPPVPESDRALPEMKDVKRIIAEAPADLALFARLLIATGSRPLEVWRMGWDDIAGDQITVHGAKGRGGSTRDRFVTLDPDTLLAIEQHRRWQEKECSALGVATPERILAHADGRHCPAEYLAKRLSRFARERCGIELVARDLRHCASTWLLDEGVPVHIVAKRQGHDPSVLMRVYAKRRKEADRQAAEVMGRLLA